MDRAAAKVLKGQLGEISILVVVPVEEYDKEKMAYLQRVENTKELVVNFPIRNKLEVTKKNLEFVRNFFFPFFIEMFIGNSW